MVPSDFNSPESRGGSFSSSLRPPRETESALGVMVSIFLGEVLVGHTVGNETDTCCLVLRLELSKMSNASLGLTGIQGTSKSPAPRTGDSRPRHEGDVLPCSPSVVFPTLRVWSEVLDHTSQRQLHESASLCVDCLAPDNRAPSHAHLYLS